MPNSISYSSSLRGEYDKKKGLKNLNYFPAVGTNSKLPYPLRFFLSLMPSLYLLLSRSCSWKHMTRLLNTVKDSDGVIPMG